MSSNPFNEDSALRTMEKVTYDFHEYRITNKRDVVTKFKHVASNFLCYMSKLRPKITLKVCGGFLLQYQYNWVRLVENILRENGCSVSHIPESDQRKIIPYDRIVQSLDLPRLEIKYDEYYKNIWGPVYWEFLHLTSILCMTPYQIDLFSTNMMNFNLCIICDRCAFNYKDKDPFKFTMLISLSQDPVTAIYNLHNLVNEALHKSQYPFEDFIRKYNLQVVKDKKQTFYFISS